MLLLDELVRRNVIRLAVTYVAGSWLIIQAVETIFPAFGFGPGAVRNIIVMLAIGFVPAMVFAWLYELTPEGLKLEKDVDRSVSITPQTGKRLDRIIIAVLAVAVIYFAVDKFLIDPGRDATSIREAAEKARSEVIVDAYGEQSIAVLPFVDMSPDGDQEYFSDGIAEELINFLAKVPDLRVISRSSAFSFKGEKIDVRAIAGKLRVAHVLEGSLRVSGDRLRITAQLIDARSDTHLWSQTYDREFGDIFAIQDEIAAEVVAQLKDRLLTDQVTHSTNPEAYALFLQARHVSRLAAAESYEQSIALFQQAIDMEPMMTEAWNGLSRTYVNMSVAGIWPPEKGFELGRKATMRLLTLDPEHAIGHSRLGWIAMAYDRDLESAAQYMQQAISLSPNDPAVAANTGTLCIFLGRINDGIDLYEFALERDPVNISIRVGLGQIYAWTGRYDDALAMLQSSLLLSPDLLYANYYIGIVHLLNSNYEDAMAAMQVEPAEHMRFVGRSLVHFAAGHKEESDAALRDLIELYGASYPYQIATVHAYRGDADRAFEWLATAEQSNVSTLVEIVGDPLFANLHDDPRWVQFLRQIGKAPEQLDAIKLEPPRR
jgi:TolB-like protein/Flp pilus assembly protein TadD